jgi:YbbR domain-containing protein
VEEGKGIWPKKLLENEVSPVNRDIFVFAFFLILSFIFWYLNSLGKEIEGDLKYPVRYINPPKDRVIADNPPSKLSFYLKGPGYSILKLKISGNLAPVVIDFSKVTYKRIQGNNSMNCYIVSSGLIQTFTKQLGADFEIISIKPDTIFFTFARIISKKIPVVTDETVNTEWQYRLKGSVIYIPDSVKITGIRQFIDTVCSLSTNPREYNRLNKPATRTVPVSTSKFFSISSGKVTMKIPVEQFTEAELTVPIEILKIPDSLEIRIFHDVITVKCLVALSDYSKVKSIHFNAKIDLNKMNMWSEKKLAEGLINVPSYVSSLRFAPENVDFII